MNSVTYILYSEDVDYCVLIDCGEYDTLKPVLERLGKRVKAVLLTHGHSDHIWGLLGLLEDEPDVDIYTLSCGHDELQNSRLNLSFYHDQPFVINHYKKKSLDNMEIIHFNGFPDIEVIETPGHDSSCITYRIGQNLFTGDAYIPGVNPFCKFPRSNKERALTSASYLCKLEQEGCTIHPGHHTYKP